MTDLIPAAPGWYVHSTLIGATDPVIAWSPTTNDGNAALLPYVPNGPGYVPILLTAEQMSDGEWSVVYRPNYDPATEDGTTYSLTPPKAKPATGVDDAILVTEDGIVTTLNLPANPENFAEYAAAVLRCATVEHLELAPGVSLWFDEDGRANYPYNPVIDGLRALYGTTDSTHGPVLITGYGQRVEPLAQEVALRLLGEINRLDIDEQS
ncbi:hypothetical protein [Streptomyces sp. NPDC091215]|uniref:hypothetical protein n=1 Tax=Streptomyces sp. NPDC091215 TaxID=3155192 RepID=UPI00343046AC